VWREVWRGDEYEGELRARRAAARVSWGEAALKAWGRQRTRLADGRIRRREPMTMAG
ncbi:hypothetical protein IMZ48_43925, partial [Candidatus Bathyarchaeota archaeon]|nr:hypothetical protein [Candidatus Bathyarchaeota archaeon]